MADLYALTEKDVATLKELVKAWRHEFLDRPSMKRQSERGQRADVIFGVVDASVAGTSNGLSDPPSGTMNVYNFSSTGGTTDSGLDETVYNLSSVARTTAEYTVAVRDYESGKWLAVAGGGLGYKKLCRFVLDAALATSDPSGSGLLTNQYGDGTAHSTGAITVGNLLTRTADVYLFEGTSGAAGLAYYTTGTAWRILNMECP